MDDVAAIKLYLYTTEELFLRKKGTTIKYKTNNSGQ